MKDTDTPKTDPNSDESSPDELLGDLESIKQLLDEEGQPIPDQPPATGEPASDLPAGRVEASVPLLDDMIDGALEVRETSFLSVTPALGSSSSQQNRPLGEDLFDALLGDDWQTSAADVLTEARGAIEAHRNDWTPADTDELNAALRVRIDETLSKWLRDMVRNRLDELRAELLIAAESAINDKIRALVEQQASGNKAADEDGETPDGI